MAGLKIITEREKAAIRYGLAYGVTNRVQLYKIAYDGTQEKLDSISDIRAVATRWYHSQKIQDFIETERKEWEIRQQRIRSEIRVEVEAQVREEMRTGKRDKDGITDYSDPRNQLRKLNQIISTASDSAEVLDAIKVLNAKQSQTVLEDVKSEAKKRVLAYIPIVCGYSGSVAGCILYDLAKQSMQKITAQHLACRTPKENLLILDDFLKNHVEDIKDYAVALLKRRIEVERERLKKWND